MHQEDGWFHRLLSKFTVIQKLPEENEHSKNVDLVDEFIMVFIVRLTYYFDTLQYRIDLVQSYIIVTACQCGFCGVTETIVIGIVILKIFYYDNFPLCCIIQVNTVPSKYNFTHV